MKPELLFPAGSPEALRAAVANGADAVYLGLPHFNARRHATNFASQRLPDIVAYAHERGVRVYVALNILVKNHELDAFVRELLRADQAGADAVILQDPSLVPLVREHTSLPIHISTQATITNSYGLWDLSGSVDRVILPRELPLADIGEMSRYYTTEVFVHGALCFSVSGQCLFSSMAGGRSGNRGCCAQPCRKRYNNKYAVSTKDLCLLGRLPELARAGVQAFKIEGRMRTPLYVATTARIYRKYIDRIFSPEYQVNEEDIKELRQVFNREFTEGFAFERSVVDSRKPMNRGLYLGKAKNGRVRLREPLSVGDGVAVWRHDGSVHGERVTGIMADEPVQSAARGDIVSIRPLQPADYEAIYKTSAAAAEPALSDPVQAREEASVPEPAPVQRYLRENSDTPRLFVRVHSKKGAIAAAKAGADILYYDLFSDDFAEVRENAGVAVYAATPRLVFESDMDAVLQRIRQLRPAGVLVGNRGVYNALRAEFSLHLDYNLNIMNDLAVGYYDAWPVISPELNLEELRAFANKRFIAYAHGQLALMTTAEPLRAPELVDEEHRHFPVRGLWRGYEILNCRRISLLQHVRTLLDSGIRYFYLDEKGRPGSITRLYRQILEGEKDSAGQRGYTTGHLFRGVH